MSSPSLFVLKVSSFFSREQCTFFLRDQEKPGWWQAACGSKDLHQVTQSLRSEAPLLSCSEGWG